MGKIKALIDFIFAEDEDLSLENRLFLTTVIVGILTSLAGSIVNLFLITSLPATIIPLVLCFLLLILYYFVRFKHIIEPFVFPLISISMVGIAVIWVFNGGINGSNVFAGFVILILGLIIVSDRKKKYVVILFLVLFTTVYILQLLRPDLVTKFSSETERWIDSIITLFYTSWFIFLIVKFLHQSYTAERLKSQESEQKYRMLTENIKDVVWTLDTECKQFTYVSPSILQQRGFTPDELMNLPFDASFLPDMIGITHPIILERLEAFQTKNTARSLFYNDIVEQKCKDGGLVWTEIVSEYYLNSKNNHVEVLGVSRDVSERKKAEQEILHQSEELKKIIATKDKFFSIVAHDLRSPFNSFLGLTQIMAEELPILSMTSAQNLAVSMNKSATNLYRLLENLLQWSQIQNEALPFNPEFISLQVILDESMIMVHEPAKNKGIEVIGTVSGNTVVFTDVNMLQTIIRNLIFNAVKYSIKGGKVTVSVKTAGDKSLELSVQDTGIGMSREILDNLFRIDVRTNRKGTDGEPSTGLGLLLCKEFVEKQGGWLGVESEVGKGSRFYFTIPCEPKPLPADQMLKE
jgi:PAS domain S-box-containing protein